MILAKHQSTWETFFLSAYFEPLTQVLKRELLRVPFFGWAIMLLKPIAIDRDNPKAALRQVAKQGHERLEQGAWVLIFPEGTRVPVGQPAGSPAAARRWQSMPDCRCCRSPTTPACSGPRQGGASAPAPSRWSSARR